MTLNYVSVAIGGGHGVGKDEQLKLLLNDDPTKARFSMGDDFRARDKAGESGYEAVRTGGLVPLEKTLPTITRLLVRISSGERLVVVGLPRSWEQSRHLYSEMKRLGLIGRVVFIYLCLPLEEGENRIRLFRKDQKRDDDTPEAMRERKRVCEEEVYPGMRVMRRLLRGTGCFIQVYAGGSIEEVHQNILKKLKAANLSRAAVGR